METIGFDNEKYLKEQSRAILERAEKFDNKLYLEFGGKLAFDYHAARVLPGFDPNVKLRLLQKLKDKIDIIICIYSGDIERKKIRADFGIAYDADTLRIIDSLRELGLPVKAVVVTRYNDQYSVKTFMNKLKRRGVNVYAHRAIKDYPSDLDTIFGPKGYGANAYIETEKPIVIVTGPGPSSGKMGTCLSQVYHEQLRGVNAGYAKFETFPVWDLPLQHPVNVAYEAATADIGDVNMVDPYHLEAYKKTAINYNRDIEVFPVVRRMLAKIMKPEQLYQSPTDMGVNRIGFAITDDAAVQHAACQEIIRRSLKYHADYERGITDEVTLERIDRLLHNMNINITDRPVVLPARDAAEKGKKNGKGNMGVFCGAALELKDGTIITGKNSPLLHASASCVINAIKHLAGLPDDLLLLSPDVIASVGQLRKEILKSRRVSLDLGEALITLSVSVPTNSAAKMAMAQLQKLSGCEMHLTHLPSPGDEGGLRRLGVNFTADPFFAEKDLFVE